MTHTIYGLSNGDRVVYVGVTTRKLNTRLAELKCHRKRYSLPDGELEIFSIEETTEWEEAEQFWISYLKALGAHLVNQSGGGRGSSGYKQTEESNKKRSIAARRRKQSAETKAKIGAANRGRKRPDVAERNRRRARS